MEVAIASRAPMPLQPVEVIDAREMEACDLASEAEQRMCQVPKGEVMAILCRHYGAVTAARSWAQAAGHEYLGARQEVLWRVFVKRNR